MLSFLAGCFLLLQKTTEAPVIPPTTPPVVAPPAPSSLPQPKIVDKVLLDAPFQSQAPFGDWAQPWQDACEEASIIVAQKALEQAQLSRETMRDEILKLVEYQNKNFGTYRSTNISKTAEMARVVYGLETEILENPTVTDLKEKLSAGHLIIAPLAGRLLHNPYFTGAGPIYHMFVIIGFDDQEKIFITHEVGTRHGRAYKYPYQTVMKAIHDLPVPVMEEITEEEILKGAKKVLVTVSKI